MRSSFVAKYKDQARGFRIKAQGARMIAETMSTLEGRETVLQIALHYDKLAARFEELAKSHDDSDLP